MPKNAIIQVLPADSLHRLVEQKRILNAEKAIIQVLIADSLHRLVEQKRILNAEKCYNSGTAS